MLLNENRNRVPRMTAAPDNTTDGKVGDLILLTDGTSFSGTSLYICITSNPGTTANIWAQFDAVAVIT